MARCCCILGSLFLNFFGQHHAGTCAASRGMPPTGARVALLVTLITSLTLTLFSLPRIRGTLYAQQVPAVSASSLSAAAMREARLRGGIPAASTPPPPPPLPFAASPPPSLVDGETRASREWATQANLGRGWKRSLPPDVAATAAWFAHERTLSALFDDVDVGGVVWLTFSNTAFKDFTINWAAHIYRLRRERAAVIAALDVPLQNALLAEQLPFFGYDHGRTSDLRSDVVEFRRLGALKGELVLKILRAERHVLLSDVDVAWLKDPTATLHELAAHADVMSATDCLHITGDEAKAARSVKGINRCAYNPGNQEGHAAFNTGVVFFRPSTAAKAFAAAWRARLVSVEKSAWLDDQLAFNELVWHGFRNHPDRAVHAASLDGRVIRVRMMAAHSQTRGEPRQQDEGVEGRLPAPFPPPAWTDGWKDLMRNRSLAFNPAAADPAGGLQLPIEFTLAPLPARHFCSGHLFWEQQNMEARECASVHTTFVEGGNLGKLWRMREAALWLLDPPEHYEPSSEGGQPPRYITYVPPQPPTQHAPVRNMSHSDVMTDKYKAGWLVPDALNLSPRLRQHLELVRRHILALRDAMAIAFVTKRILVLPRLPCLCDRSEGPLVLRECRYEASELPVPFICPLTHLFDIFRFQSIRTRPAHSGRIDFRESSFLDNPLTPQVVREGQRVVRIVPNTSAATVPRPAPTGFGPIKVLSGSSDAQIVAALAAHADVPVLRLTTTEGVFGGWTNERQRSLFELVVSQSSILTGSWCCSSWYKPSGSINYATPLPTVALPSGCGDAQSDVGGGTAPHASLELRQQCQAEQARRLASQQPFDFVYALAGGRDGQDGYFRLMSGTGDRFGLPPGSRASDGE